MKRLPSLVLITIATVAATGCAISPPALVATPNGVYVQPPSITIAPAVVAPAYYGGYYGNYYGGHYGGYRGGWGGWGHRR